MTEIDTTQPGLTCSFCGCDSDHARVLIASPEPGVAICDSCVDICQGVLRLDSCTRIEPLAMSAADLNAKLLH